MKEYIIAGVVIFTFIASIIKYIIGIHNYFVRQKQEIEKQKSGIEIALTARYDTLVKLNKTVVAYSGHETNLLTGVTKIRKGMSAGELSEIAGQQSQAFSALVENYPELKASVNFMHLQETINDLENTIQATRRIYNNEVSEYNSAAKSFPRSIIANKMKVEQESYFEAEAKKLNDVDLVF
jgi:LemA protein